MINFNFEGQEYNMKTEWEELTTNQYLNIMKVYQKNQIISLGEEMLAQQILEVLCDVDLGHFDEITVELILELMPKITNLSQTIEEFTSKSHKTPPSWEIDGTIYSYRRRYEDCNAGEITDIKTYIGEKQYIWEYMLDIAAVLIRPAELLHTPGGEPYYKLSKRHPLDHETNKSRIGGIPFVEIKTYIDFFLSGWFKRTITTNGFTEQEAEKIVADLKSLPVSEHSSYLTSLGKEI